MRTEKPRADRKSSVLRSFWSSKVGFLFSLLLISTASVWLRTGFPVSAITTTDYDDHLFIRLATYLGSGDWLGPWDQFTLAKGMFYPLFIAVTHFVSIPLKIAEQIVYLLACGMTAEFVRRSTRSNPFALVLFALLAFNPVLWHSELARVIREALYVGLSLAVVVLFVIVVFPGPNRQRFFYRILAGLSLGIIGGAFWLTREEGIWIIPALAVVALGAAWRILRPGVTTASNMQQPSQRSSLVSAQLISAQMKAVVWPLVVAILGFFAVDLLVAGLNYEHYGIFETNEFRSRSFLKAYGALTRIHHDHWHNFVPFPTDARQRAYAVSSAARELKPSFEGPYGAQWGQGDCSKQPLNCSEVYSSWFMWEFRGSVSNAGHYRSAPDTMRFYDTLADQINAACDDHSIECSREREALSPPFRLEYIGQSIKPGLTVAEILFTLRDGPVGTHPSVGPPDLVSTFAETVGGVSMPPKRVIQGWAASAFEAPSVQIFSPMQHDLQPPASIDSAADVMSQHPNLKAIRFKLETRCEPNICALLLTLPDGRRAGIQLSQISEGQTLSSGSVLLQIENIKVLPEEHQPQLRIASFISWVYAIGIPILSILAVIGMELAVGSSNWRVVPFELWVLTLASAAAIVSRIALLAYITATAFPAASLLYSSPASPFTIIFAALGTYCGWSVLRNRRPRVRQESRCDSPRLEGKSSAKVTIKA
jgi:hypothetical protein